MRGLIGVAAIALVLSGCSGEDAEPEAEKPTASATAEARSLVETCPLVEQATPTGLAPSESKISAYRDELDRLAAEGDTETQNALQAMQSAVAHSLEANPGSDALAAFDEWTAAVELLADRCNAVGSGAFQG